MYEQNRAMGGTRIGPATTGSYIARNTDSIRRERDYGDARAATYRDRDALRGRSIRDDDLETEGLYKSRTGLYIDDGLILLGIFLGGVAGYAAAATVRASERKTEGRKAARRQDYDGWARWKARESGSSQSRSSGRKRSVEHDETATLIASNKVEGTTVYDRNGQKIGKIHNFMVGKRSGEVAYAVASFGGFLGIGETYHAVPWEELDYSEDKGGYVIDADKERLMNAPHYAAGEDPFSRQDYGAHVRSFWAERRTQ